MNCEVSSIQPESSTAPACRNISHGERACRAPAASAAARDPSNGRKRQPATSATRSITPVPAQSTNRTSRTTPAAAPGTTAASLAPAGCSRRSVGIMNRSIYRSLKAQGLRSWRNRDNFSADAKRKEIDGLGGTGIVTGQQGAHVGGNTGNAEQSGFPIEHALDVIDGQALLLL